MKIKYNNGITLIALVITIIVLLILASVTIAAISGDNGILNNASLAKVSTEFASYKEEVELYKTNKMLDNYDFDADTLTAGKTTIEYEGKPEGETGNIKTVIQDLDDKYIDKFIIIKGNLYLMAVGDTSDVEIKAAEATGIEVMPYEITEEGELLSSNKNLALQGGDGGVVIPEIVTSIGSGAFSGVEGLKQVTIPGTVKKIGSDAFSYNNTLETVIIEDGVEEIGDYAFKGCSSLKSVTMTDSVTDLGQEAFRGCISLEEVKLSENITAIKDYTFQGCICLKTINLPGNLKIIGGNSFNGCLMLNNIEIGKNVSGIDSSAFSNCENLLNLTVDSSNKNFVIVGDILYSGDRKQIITLLAGIRDEKNLVIEEGIEKIGENLFSMCKELETIHLPSTLKSITGSAFTNIETLSTITISNDNPNYKVEDNMLLSKDGTQFVYATSNRTSLTIPEGVKIVKNNSILGGKIESVIIANQVEELESFVFNNCYKIKSITLGKNINKIEPGFKAWGVPNTNKIITIDNENSYYKIDGNLILTSDEKTVVTFINTADKFVIPNGIENISDDAFVNSGLKEIELPSTLIKIGYRTFQYNYDLIEIDIPASVESMGNDVFSACPNLNAINIDKPENSITGAPWDAPKGLRIVNWNG